MSLLYHSSQVFATVKGALWCTCHIIARKFDKLYLDHIAQGLHRGQFLPMASRGEISEKDFAAELPDIVAGKKPGRENPDERLMCELVGMGSPDLCIATIAYNRITESGDELTEVDMMG